MGVREQARYYRELAARELELEKKETELAERKKKSATRNRQPTSGRRHAQGDFPTEVVVRRKVNFRLPEDLVTKIEQEAGATRTTVTRVLELALVKYLAEVCPTCGQAVLEET